MLGTAAHPGEEAWPSPSGDWAPWAWLRVRGCNIRTKAERQTQWVCYRGSSWRDRLHRRNSVVYQNKSSSTEHPSRSKHPGRNKQPLSNQLHANKPASCERQNPCTHTQAQKHQVHTHDPASVAPAPPRGAQTSHPYFPAAAPTCAGGAAVLEAKAPQALSIVLPTSASVLHSHAAAQLNMSAALAADESILSHVALPPQMHDRSCAFQRRHVSVRPGPPCCPVPHQQRRDTHTCCRALTCPMVRSRSCSIHPPRRAFSGGCPPLSHRPAKRYPCCLARYTGDR